MLIDLPTACISRYMQLGRDELSHWAGENYSATGSFCSTCGAVCRAGYLCNRASRRRTSWRRRLPVYFLRKAEIHYGRDQRRTYCCRSPCSFHRSYLPRRDMGSEGHRRQLLWRSRKGWAGSLKPSPRILQLSVEIGAQEGARNAGNSLDNKNAVAGNAVPLPDRAMRNSTSQSDLRKPPAAAFHPYREVFHASDVSVTNGIVQPPFASFAGLPAFSRIPIMQG